MERIYARYAAFFLLVTVASGVWMRSAFVQPEVMGGFAFEHAIHAHSHLAFFGWTTMALFAILVSLSGTAKGTGWLRLHAHTVGLASAAAFVGFLAGGYTAWTIALSALHVFLWYAFIVASWRSVAGGDGVHTRFYKAALVFLGIAGAGAMAPGIVMARGITSPWIGEMAIHSFLTPFMMGWLGIGAMGIVYHRLGTSELSIWALRLTAVGILPSAFLHPIAAPPADWMTLVGRGGTVAIGIGTAIFAYEVLRGRTLHPLVRFAGFCAGIKGVAEVMIAAGIGLEWIAIRNLTIAYLHLMLLGIVTPILIYAALRVPRAPLRSALFGGGLLTMVASLAALGLPVAAAGLASVGIGAAPLLWLALVGAAACAIAVLMLLIVQDGDRSAATTL